MFHNYEVSSELLRCWFHLLREMRMRWRCAARSQESRSLPGLGWSVKRQARCCAGDGKLHNLSQKHLKIIGPDLPHPSSHCIILKISEAGVTKLLYGLDLDNSQRVFTYDTNLRNRKVSSISSLPPLIPVTSISSILTFPNIFSFAGTRLNGDSSLCP